MLRVLARSVRASRNGLAPARSFSEGKPPGAVTGRLAALSEETVSGNKLFQNVAVPEGMTAAGHTSSPVAAGAAAAGSTGSSGAATEAVALPAAITAIGNGLFFAGTAVAAYFGYYYWRYEVDELEHIVSETRKPENAFPGSNAWVPVMEWYVDHRRSLEGEMRKYADPPSDKLLPDLPPAARHIKTLVLDLDELLVHSDWTRGRGWRTFKRQGVEEFIADMAQYYELVVYTSQVPTYADPILDRLDPQRLIQYRLYRDSTQYVGGRHVRDLSKLNRDLGQVLMLTADPEACALQPGNAIKMKPWKMESGDTALLDMLPFLEAVVTTHVPDVRSVVGSYEGLDIPEAFRARMQAVAGQRAERQKAPRRFLSSLAGGGK